MKYRVKQKGNKFYPQKKSFLFWKCLPGEAYQYILIVPSLTGEEYGTAYRDIFFNTLAEAQEYLEFYKEHTKITIHEIN